MRVTQLSRHIKRYFGDIYDVSLNPLGYGDKFWTKAWIAAQPKGNVYVISKYTIIKWHPEMLDLLRRKAAAILVDYVDLPMDYVPDWGIDCHITTSFAGADGMRARQAELRAAGKKTGGEVATVLHNYDAAIDAVTPDPPTEKLAICYLGRRDFTPTEPEFENEITFLDGSSRAGFERDIARIGAFNCHYCVRSPMQGEHVRSWRPFTKGITAAALNSVIITNRQAHDAETLLGADYPFLVDDIERASLLAGMNHLRDSFGGPEWTRALERVMDLKARSTHRAIAGQLHEAIQSVT